MKPATNISLPALHERCAASIRQEPQGPLVSSRLYKLQRQLNAAMRGPLLVVAVAGVLALVPLMAWGIPSGADLPNHYRFALPFYDSISRGHLYPGWLAESNFGLGDARFRFYPPGFYYLLVFLKLFTNWYAASVAAFTALSVLGGLGTYFWARGAYPEKVAMWAGVIYIVAPYHLNELYQASLLSEYAACSILPFVFAFLERTCRRQRVSDVAGLAAAYALLILTHLPLTVIGSLAALVYALFLLRRQLFWSTVLRLTTGCVLGLAASAFFWTTMLAELPWIKGNSSHQNVYYDYRANFLFSSHALTNRNTWYANLLGLAVLGTLLPALVLVRKTLSRTTRAIAVLTTVTLLMTTELSRPLWMIIPKLAEVQFPWRWLALTSLAGSVLLAASLSQWKRIWRRGFRPVHLVPLFGLALSMCFIATQVVWDSDYLRRQDFEDRMTSIRASASFKDWMPSWASEGTAPYSMKESVNASARSISINTWEPEHRVFTIGQGQAGEARVKTFYYPLWAAANANQTLETRPAEDGSLLISVPADKTTVSLDFREPPRVWKVRLVSLAAWLLILTLSLSGMARMKRQNPLPN